MSERYLYTVPSPAYYFDGTAHESDSWADKISGVRMTAAKGGFHWDGSYLAVTKSTDYFRFSTAYGSYGTFEALVKVDASFVPVSTTSWYTCSCILGCELGGQQRDWGIIIDRNGYFAIGYGFSSIAATDVKANDGQWHTVAMVVGSSYMQLYIDGVQKQSVNITMSGSAIAAFGVGWNNSSPNESITGHIGTVKLWNVELTADEIVGSYEASTTWLAYTTREMRYLVRSEDTLYTVTDGALTALSETEVSASLFRDYGVDELPDGSLLAGLTDPEVLYWHDSTDDLPALSLTVTGTPPVPQVVVTDLQDMSHYTILGIESATVDASEDVLWAISFDDGVTWLAHDGSQWFVLAPDDLGMTTEALRNISVEAWADVVTSDAYRLRFALPSIGSYMSKVVINYIN